MIKAIFFDLCGVIITLGTQEFFDELSKYVKVPSSKISETFYRHLGENESGKITEDEFYKKMFHELGVSYDLEKTKEIRTSYRVEISGMKNLVEKLKENYRVGYISNDAKEMASRCSKKFGLDELFDTGILAYEVGARKDSPKLFHELLKRENLKPEECVFTDDTEKNLTEAKKLGFHTIVYKSKEQLVSELKKLGVKV